MVAMFAFNKPSFLAPEHVWAINMAASRHADAK
jgi:hypothetical protein